LSGSEEDLGTSDYLQLKEQLASMRLAGPGCRCLYLMGRRADGVVFFFADSLQPSSEEYAPPGLIYAEVPDPYLRVFATGQEAVVGPVADRWGTSVTALVPLTDPQTDELVALLGMDMEASDWRWEIIRQCLVPFAATLLLVILVLLLDAQRRLAGARRESEQKLRSLYDAMTEGVCLHELIYDEAGDAIDYRILDVNPRYEEILGLGKRDVVDKPASEVYGGDAPPYLATYAEVARTGKPARFEVYFPPMDRHFSIAAFATGNDHFATVFDDITERVRAEGELRESEERLRGIVENSTNLFFSHTPDHVLTYLSPQVKEILGYTQEEALIKWTQLASDDPINEIGLAQTARAIETGEAQPPYELELVHSSGERIRVEVREAPLVVDGRTVSIVGALTDITERVRAEEALRESDQRFRSYVETTQDLIWESDAEGILTYLNPAWEQVTGYSLSELLGRSYFDFVAEDEVEGKRVEFSHYPEGYDDGYPTTYITKDGSEIQLVFNTVPLYDADRNIIGTLGSAFDLTERVRAEEALRESEARYRDLFDNSPVSLWEEDFSKVKELLDDLRSSGVSDLRAHLNAHPDVVAHCIQLIDIVDVNKATVDLYEAESKDEILGSLDKFVVDDSVRDLREEISALYEGKRALESEIVGRSLTGKLLDCVTKINIAPGYEDSWSKVLVSVTDITERVRAEEALQESKQRLEETLAELREMQEQMLHQERLAAVGQLSAGIAHDFNNILASIVLYTQMSLQMSELSPTIRKRVEVIAREADRAAGLVQQMLDFGRRAVLRRESLDLEPLLGETIVLLGRTLPENVRTDLTFEPGDYFINADPERVQQAVVNLALNARDAMPDGGELHIGLSRIEDGEINCVDCGRVVGGEWVQVTVTDTGTGIAEEVLPHIFEPFFTTRAPLGHGLGLAQTYGIVKQHEGHLEVETEVGRGTTFKLYWPALSVDERDAQVQAQPNGVQRKGQTILVVEDHAAMRKALVDVMDMLGYQVLEAANGQEALVVCEQHKHDIALVLSDWVMPSMDGLALVGELEKRGMAFKVLMLTGHPLDDETKRTLPESVVGWALKPPSLEQLTEAVAQALAGPSPALLPGTRR
jgi:two-component system, cell cycle sensor histidine kinase and response regulator CckA